MPPIDHSALRFFDSARAWRAWLKANHDRATVCWVGFHRKDTGVKSITYPEALEEALCYGWIDGVRKSLGDGRYTIRFTPRKATSIWSKVNVQLVARLKKEGRMTAAGTRAFRGRVKEKSRQYSYENDHASLGRDGERRFRADRGAWKFFQGQAPSYRKLVTFWIATAKKPETRERRLATLIADSAAGRRIGLVSKSRE